MRFSIALGAIFAFAETNREQVSLSAGGQESNADRARHHAHEERAARPRPPRADRPDADVEDEEDPIRPRGLAAERARERVHDAARAHAPQLAADRHPHHSFVDRSANHHRGNGGTAAGGSPGTAASTGGTGAGSKAHQDQGHAAAGGAGQQASQKRNDFDIMNFLALQDGHRAKSRAEREREADTFCSRRDLTQKELDGCRVRSNATRMTDYALHLNDAMRMKRVVKGASAEAHRAELEAQREWSSVDELEQSMEHRRVARYHKPQQAEGQPATTESGILVWVLRQRKIELALILMLGGLLVTCVNVYGKKSQPRRRLRLQDQPEQFAEPADTAPPYTTYANGYEETS